MYLCNRFKLCRVSNGCGKDCILTKDKAHEYIPRAGQYIQCNNVKELEWYREQLRETEVSYRVEGFKIIFLD